jgi:hypothetical protein
MTLTVDWDEAPLRKWFSSIVRSGTKAVYKSAFNEDLFRDRMQFLLSKKGKEVWEEFGCPE